MDNYIISKTLYITSKFNPSLNAIFTTSLCSFTSCPFCKHFCQAPHVATGKRSAGPTKAQGAHPELGWEGGKAGALSKCKSNGVGPWPPQAVGGGGGAQALLAAGALIVWGAVVVPYLGAWEPTA